MVPAALVPGLVGMLLCSILPISLNPTIMLPWAMPNPVLAAAQTRDEVDLPLPVDLPALVIALPAL